MASDHFVAAEPDDPQAVATFIELMAEQLKGADPATRLEIVGKLALSAKTPLRLILKLEAMDPDLSDFDASVGLVPGSRLLVMTDGLTETRAPGGELLGADELVNLLVAAGASELSPIVEEMLARASEFRQGEPQQDDVTVLLARYDP